MGRIAYVGSRTTKERRARGVGLSVWCVDDELHWTQIQAVELVNPSFLALASDGRTLFTVHGDQDAVTSLRVLADGTLERLDTRPTGGRNPVHLSLSRDERTLIVANYATGSVASLPIGAEGSLGEPCDVLAFPGEPGPHRVEQRGSHPHHVPRWPGTDLFVVPDKGLDLVHVVQLSNDGKLLLAGSKRCCAGCDLCVQLLLAARKLLLQVAAPIQQPGHTPQDENRRQVIYHEIDEVCGANDPIFSEDQHAGDGGSQHQGPGPAPSRVVGAVQLRRWSVLHGAQTRRNTSVPLVPPKPKLFFTATSIFMSRAALAQ